MRQPMWIIAAALAFFACSAAPPRQQPAASAVPALEKNIVYDSPAGEALMLDFIRPRAGQGPFPLVIWLHGGGWRAGDRSDYHGGLMGLANQGWAGATVQYRFAPKHKFPAQVDDVRKALAFLRTNAQRYNIDPNRIGVVGASAGGHLALMLGLTPESNGQPSPGIRAVVSFAGPAHFPSWRIGELGETILRNGMGVNGLDGLIADFLGTADRNAPVMAVASPVTYVHKGNPAVLSLQGSADPLSPPQQAQVLHAALRKAGVTEKLVEYPGGGHSLAGKQMEQSLYEMVDFLNVHVRDAR